ncbi:hypothetical protein OG723_43120 (plasmid) [Streptomyces sp. NBC_01278]|uniref:hypothetical protein n=1 Tax=Streptomyces sp. NBC_01278 TaxID=2903809 RepID=UPI002E300C0A|nr:hypothetical protein [Streptomyces sp. NBC_01278]
MHNTPSADGVTLPHVRELAQFLALCHGQGPAILWPEQERVAHEGQDATTVLAAEGRELARLTGLQPTIEWHRADEGGARPLSTGSSGHLLVQQEDGAGTWRLHAVPGAEESFSCRLRSGEVLYVPPGWSWRADLTPGARLLLTRLGPAAGEPAAGSPAPS